MLTKITSKNQITIPKKIVDQLPDVQYFDLQIKEGIVLLKPVKIYDTNLEQIRSKMKKLDEQAKLAGERARTATENARAAREAADISKQEKQAEATGKRQP